MSDKDPAKKYRKSRYLTDEDKKILEEYAKTHKFGEAGFTKEKNLLAEKLGVSKHKVTSWFVSWNKKNKFKKLNEERKN